MGRPTATPPTGARKQVSKRPAAPPVFRPQPTPKALQKKSALPDASAPRSATVKPSVGRQQTPSPPQAPRPFQPPVAHARPRPAPLARPSVLQLMEVNNSSSGSDDDDWQKDAENYEAQFNRYKELSQQQKAKRKAEKSDNNTTNSNNTTTTTNVRQSSLRVTGNHLEKFDTSVVNKALKEKKRPGADQVTIILKVNGELVGNANGNNEHDAEITSPSSDVCVVNTTGDGEVAPLTKAMRDCLGHLKKAKNQKSAQNFTVALFGPWGACDGCKQRILKFVALWEEEAIKYMKTGVVATLKVTYRYVNTAQDFEMVWGTTTYGWYQDGAGPCSHTIEADVVGANGNVK